MHTINFLSRHHKTQFTELQLVLSVLWVLPPMKINNGQNYNPGLQSHTLGLHLLVGLLSQFICLCIVPPFAERQSKENKKERTHAKKTSYSTYRETAEFTFYFTFSLKLKRRQKSKTK